MKNRIRILKAALITGILLLCAGIAAGQAFSIVSVMRDSEGALRIIQFSIVPIVNPENIVDVNVFSLDGGDSLSLGKPMQVSRSPIYEIKTDTPLKTTMSSTGEKLNDYILAVKIKGADGKETWINKAITMSNTSAASQTVLKESDDIDDSAFYIDGEIKGAYKKKTRFSTKIKLKKLEQTKDGWIYSKFGFFNLNASSDPEADPDVMEVGYNFARVVRKHFYWDNEVKIESERDFDNTNFIFSTRGIWIPAGQVLTRKNGDPTSLVFFRPYTGVELGKNLRSQVAAAKGDGIARVLVGADLRFNVPINLDKGQEINWTNSFTRRWLLSNELGYEVDDDGVPQLVRFGRSPRDYFNSKASFGFNKFFGAFIEYEWGQLPPSYKFVEHRFRAGLFFKFKFGTK